MNLAFLHNCFVKKGYKPDVCIDPAKIVMMADDNEGHCTVWFEGGVTAVFQENLEWVWYQINHNQHS